MVCGFESRPAHQLQQTFSQKLSARSAHTMTVQVETLDKLERRITLTMPASTIAAEVESRLKRLSRTVKADGFRPGKVPMSVVTQRYGYSVHYEVMNDKVGQVFSEAVNEAKLRVAGAPRITEKEGTPDGEVAFDATFEVYPEVKLGDLAAAEVERVTTEVSEAAIDKTVDILRKQRRTFAQRPAAEGAEVGDRVTIDFEGKIDGVPFDGGKADAFQFIIGEGQMLEQFDQAVRGMKLGESKTFPLQFPDDYQGKEIAGKEADFLVTLKKIEAQNLPEVNEAFAKSLGIAGASVEALRADVKKNLEREVKFRVLARNKANVMDALVKASDLDVPKALVAAETDRMVEAARADLKKRGVKDADTAPIPAEIFQPQAEKRVRLGLVVAELVRSNNLQARPDQLQAHIEEMAQSYEKPAEVVRWYLGDRQRLAEVEAVVVENNVADFVLGKAKVTDKALPFDELMTG
jgi:trigger factor